MNSETEQIFIINSSDNQPTSTTQKLMDISEPPQVNLENVQDFSNVCRTCATVTEFVIPIFDGEGLQNNLADKIRKHLPITVTEQDVLPRVVCYQCASTLLAWHELVKCCVQADGALRSRLPSIPIPVQEDSKPSVSERSQTVNQNGPLQFNVGVLAPSKSPPRYVERSGAPALSKICIFCAAVLPLHLYKDHLVDFHAELLFHCDECETYVDRKDFILHMSLHAVQYDTKSKVEKEQEKKQKLIKIKKDENENEDAARFAETPPQINTTAPRSSSSDNERSSEFSDQSDADFQFGPLPESVFEAIGDSRDSNTVSQPSSNQPSPAENLPPPRDIQPPMGDNQPPRNIVDKQQKTNRNKKCRTCPICSKTYNASSSYFYHMKHVHNKSQDHECDICGKKFITKSNLIEHSYLHSVEYRFQCKMCPKRFKARASLYIHEQIHKGTKGHSCSLCSSSFRWRSHLVKHMKRHNLEKCHVCATCGRGFSIRCDLLRHARTHTVGKHACDDCGLNFAQLRYLKVHKHKKHSKEHHTGQKDTRM